MTSDYFAKKAINMADEIWDKQGWSDEKILELLHEKMRAPYIKRAL